MLKFNAFVFKFKSHSRCLTLGTTRMTIQPGLPCKKVESERMKVFQEKLKLERIPRVSPSLRFVELVLVKTDPKTGELISESEIDPTRYGDWQHNGRVTDF